MSSGARYSLVAGGELRERDRRVDVVEGDDAARRCAAPRRRRRRLGDVGADDDRVGGGDRAAPALEVGEAVVEGEAAEAGVGQVAVRAGVPGHGALEESDGVAAGGEGGEERAVGGGVAVAPGRAEAEAEDDEFMGYTTLEKSPGRLSGRDGDERRICPLRDCPRRASRVPRSPPLPGRGSASACGRLAAAAGRLVGRDSRAGGALRSLAVQHAAGPGASCRAPLALGAAVSLSSRSTASARCA